MHSYIQISKLNDFLFCPRSVYLHTIYDNFHKKSYQRKPQIAGTIAHESIDASRYSSRKKYIVGMEVYSEKHELCGKIDIYDKEKKILIERKRTIKKIYDGQKYQLYAQMICMQEMNYPVHDLWIHSLTDNRYYKIGLPSKQEFDSFFEVLEKMKNCTIDEAPILYGSKKCPQCIYQPLCHKI